MTSEATELSLEDALGVVVELQQERRMEAAVQLCQRILDAVPGHPDALHLLGLALHRVGHGDEGVARIEQAIAAQPDFPDFHNNLGNIHALAGRVPEATAAYERAIQLRPDCADWHNNLGALYKADKRFDEAMACYERALALDPEHTKAVNNIGLLYAARGELERAVRYYIKAIELMPGNQDARHLLGMTWYTLKKYTEAAEVFRQWLEQVPDHPVAQHMYAALSGKDVPERAPDHYVEHTFDRFALSFERTLTERLEYRAPELCAQLVGDCLPAGSRGLRTLDAGCGTGLCGPLLQPVAGELAGVDLSRGMLDLAQTKGVYTDLYKAELTEFLRASPGHWQLIVSADTLCYFGSLRAFAQAAHDALEPGGWLVFSVEALEGDADRAEIQPSGRYAHSPGHLRAAFAEAGLPLHTLRGDTLRMEGGKPVAGWLVAAQRPAESGLAAGQPLADHRQTASESP